MPVSSAAAAINAAIAAVDQFYANVDQRPISAAQSYADGVSAAYNANAANARRANAARSL